MSSLLSHLCNSMLHMAQCTVVDGISSQVTIYLQGLELFRALLKKMASEHEITVDSRWIEVKESLKVPALAPALVPALPPVLG